LDKGTVSLEFTQEYNQMCFGIEELALTPRALAWHRKQWPLTDSTNVVGIKCYYSGVIRVSAGVRILRDLALQSRNPWEISMSIFIISGGPYKGLLEENYIGRPLELVSLWKELVRLGLLAGPHMDWLEKHGYKKPHSLD
jgi:hypothetical protein